MTTPATFTMSSAGRVVGWTRLDGCADSGQDLLAGGIIVGDEVLAARIKEIVAGPEPKQAVVAQPGGVYHFTPGRDTDADIAAAMLHAGGPQAHLNDAAWDVLCPEDEEPLHDGPDTTFDHGDSSDTYIVYGS